MPPEETWIRIATLLWGEEWISPLSEVFDVHRRTVERWRNGVMPVAPGIVADLMTIEAANRATRAYGALLRRMARGETLADIAESLADQRRALRQLADDGGRYIGIPALAGAMPDPHD